MNIILANALIKNGNRGCVALSISTMAIIDDIMKEAGIDYQIYLPDSQLEDRQTHHYDANGRDLVFSDWDYPVALYLRDTVKKKIRETLKRIPSYSGPFKEADFILDIGQGDSFADIYGDNRFRLIDRIHKLARKYHKPYCLLPQTIGPFEDEGIRAKARKSIAEADICMARDKQSYDYVVKNVPEQKNVKEYIDVAFFMPYENMPQDKQFVHVGLSISALLWNGGYTGNNQFGLKCDYKKAVRQIIDFFVQQPDVKLHLVPHVVNGERYIENDYAVSYDLWREYNHPNLILSPFFLGPIEAKSYISGLDFFMGARMHATIAAFSTGVPVVPMAYSRKFNGLFLDTLDYPYMSDMKAQDENEILDTIKNAFAKRQELKAIIENRMNGVVAERKQELIKDLKEFFKI